ncbi:MAG: hypothetical protein FWH28_02785 [Clostridiales bacterium]|nr:hypothetical protein [Clostridiales bacterium]
MNWKLSLMGYRESDVNLYLRDLTEVREAEIAGFDQKIKMAEEMIQFQEKQLAVLRAEAERRRARLSEAETCLAQLYARALQTQSQADTGPS